MAIPIASPRDIEQIEAVARDLVACLRGAASAVSAGATPNAVAADVAERLRQRGLTLALLGYRGHDDRDRPFPAPACVWCDDEPHDGPPSRRLLTAGGVLTIDAAAARDGWHADASIPLRIGQHDAELPATDDRAARLVAAANAVTRAAIDAMVPGGLWSVAAAAARGAADRAGVHLLPGFAGHGIGLRLHQPPTLSYAVAGRKLRLWPGMVLTVEPIVIEPPPLDPQRTVGRAPSRWSCCLEHTVVVERDGTRILTLPAADPSA